MKLPNLLDTDQAARLFVFEAKTDIEKRDRAIMELLYGSGLRLSELTKLDVRDLQMQSGFVTVQGKGNRTRQVPLGSHSIDAINTWLECRTIRTPEHFTFELRSCYLGVRYYTIVLLNHQITALWVSKLSRYDLLKISEN